MEPCTNKIKTNDDFCKWHDKHKLLYSELGLESEIKEEQLIVNLTTICSCFDKYICSYFKWSLLALYFKVKS